MARRIQVTINSKEPVSVEDYLVKLAGLGPRSALKLAFVSRQILLNGKPCKRDSAVLTGDTIDISSEQLFTKDELHIAANSIFWTEQPLVVLAETKDFVAVHKPIGVACHPQTPTQTNTILNAIVSRYPEVATAIATSRQEKRGAALEGGLVHRLDTDTSGVLLFARTKAAADFFVEAWPAFEKIYLARVSPPLPQNQSSGGLKLYLTHDPKSNKRMQASLTEQPKSITTFTEMHTISKLKDEAILLVRIHTGAMHQIRITLATLGTSIVGDTLYEPVAKRAKPLPNKILKTLLPDTVKAFAALAGDYSKAQFGLHAFTLRLNIEKLPEVLRRRMDSIQIGGLATGITAQCDMSINNNLES